MARQSIREMKLTDSVQHQAICNNCSFSGPLRDTPGEAARDGLGHVAKPGKANHIVTISTVTVRTRTLKANK
jgi:hypothetical protein